MPEARAGGAVIVERPVRVDDPVGVGGVQLVHYRAYDGLLRGVASGDGIHGAGRVVQLKRQLVHAGVKIHADADDELEAPASGDGFCEYPAELLAAELQVVRPFYVRAQPADLLERAPHCDGGGGCQRQAGAHVRSGGEQHREIYAARRGSEAPAEPAAAACLPPCGNDGARLGVGRHGLEPCICGIKFGLEQYRSAALWEKRNHFPPSVSFRKSMTAWLPPASIVGFEPSNGSSAPRISWHTPPASRTSSAPAA